MPCEWLKGPNGEIIHLKTARSGKRQECKFCHKTYKTDSGKVCDFPVGNGRTCDAQMCGECAVTLGPQQTDVGGGLKKLHDTFDLCPIHRTMAVFKDGKLEICGS